MALVTGDRVKETSITTGTGNLTLAGAVSGFRAFSAIAANSDRVYYAIRHQSAAEWEVGIGTYVSATPALQRDTVLASSNAGALVNFSAGTKDVFCTDAAQRAAKGNLSPAQITSDQNDYNPTGLADSEVLRLNVDNLRAVTGLAGGIEGRILMLVNVGAGVLHLPNENASSAAANRFSLGGDLYLFRGEGMLLVYDGTDSRWKEAGFANLSNALSPWDRAQIYEEFPNGTGLWNIATSGTGASAQGVTTEGTVTNKALGVVDLDTGTQAAGRCGAGFFPLNSFVPTLGKCLVAFRVKLPNLSNATDEFDITVGLADAHGAAGEPTDGVYFLYDRNLSVNWQFCAAGGGARTKTASSVAVGTTYVWLLALINAAWSNVDYFIRDENAAVWTLLGSIADGNIPVGSASEFTVFSAKIEKSAGTAVRNLYIDAAALFYEVRR